MAEYKWEVDSSKNLILKESSDGSTYTAVATISGGLSSYLTAGEYNDTAISYYLNYTPYQATVAANPDANPPVVAQNEAKGTITLKQAALGTAEITLTSTDSHYTLALEGADDINHKLTKDDALSEKWTVTNDSGTTASHYAAGTPTTYTVVADQNKITYAAASTQNTADITITGLKTTTATILAPLITITPKAADAPSGTKGTITIAAGALPDNPTNNTSKITLTTGTDDYNLVLASGIAVFDSTKGQPEIKSVSSGTATITRTQSAGWQEGTDANAGKTFTYNDGTTPKTLATINHLKDGATTSDLTISGTTVTLKEGALDNTYVSGNEIAVSIASGNTEYQNFTLALDPSGTNYDATNHTIGFEAIAKTWKIESTSTGKYMNDGTEEGWTLDTTANKITYTPQVDPTALVTITNLNSPTVVGGKIGTMDDGTFVEGITVDDTAKTAKLSEAILTHTAGDEGKMTVTNSGSYNISLATGIDTQATAGDIFLGGNSSGTVDIKQVVHDFWSTGGGTISSNSGEITYTAESPQKLATITNLNTEATTSGENADVTLDTTNSEVKIILGNGALTTDATEDNFITVTKLDTPTPAVEGGATVQSGKSFVFALAGGISAPETVPSTFSLGSVDSSAHTVNIIGTKAEGWELYSDSKKIKYTGDTPVTLATINNLDNDASSETGGNITLDSETKTVTLAAEALKSGGTETYTIALSNAQGNSFTIDGQDNTSINFGLSLASGIAEPATTITGQALDSAELTIANENLDIKGKLVEGWTLSKAAQTDTVNNQIIYTPEQTKTLATITGLKNSITVADSITFDSTNGEVKLKADALDAKNVTITPNADLGTGITDELSPKYHLAIDTDVPAPYATVDGNATLDTTKLTSDGIVELKGTKAAGYTVGKVSDTDTVNNKITYIKPDSSAVVATIAGLSKTDTTGVVSFASGVVTLKKAALTTGDVTLTNETSTAYSLALDSNDTEGTNYNANNKSYGFHTVNYWAKTGVNAEYWKQTAEGWTLNPDAKGITYSAPAGDTRLATIKNLSSDFTLGTSKTAAVDGKYYDTIGTGTYSAIDEENTFVEGVKVDGNTITLSKNVLGTNAAKPMTITNVTNTGANFSLALNTAANASEDLKVPETDKITNKDIWILGSTTIYKTITPESWKFANGQITYTAQKDVQTLATITGLNPNVDDTTDLTVTTTHSGGTGGTSISKGTITLNAQALNQRDVTITGDYYKLALNTTASGPNLLKKVATPTLSNTAWELNDAHTIAIYKAKVSEGYEAASDGSSVTYTAAADSKEIARVTGLNGDSKLVVSDNKQYIGIANGSTVSEALKFGTEANGQKPIVLSKDVLGTSNVAVTGTNYILELGTTGIKTGTATETTNQDGTKTVTVTAPAEETVWRVESIAAKAATSKTAAVPASTTATYKKVIPAYYTVGVDKTAITYTPEATAQTNTGTAQDPVYKDAIIATVTGLKSGLTVASDGKVVDTDGTTEVLTLNSKAVTLTKDALGTSDVTITKGDAAAAADNYTLAFTTDADKKPSEPTDNSDSFKWSVSGTTATLKGTATAGYELVTTGDDANKKITYTPENTNKTFATLTGLKNGITASELNVADDVTDKPIEHNATNKTLTLDTRVLGTTAVVLDKENSIADYTLALEDTAGSNYKVDQTGEQKKVWAVSSTTATYKNVVDTHYTLGQQEGTTGTIKDKITYVGRADAATNAVIATVTGLKNGLKVENDEISGITLGTVTSGTFTKGDGTVIQLSKDVLGTTEAAIDQGSYTLALADGVAPEQDGETFWTVSGTNASYQFKQTAGHTLDSTSKKATYSQAGTKTYVTIEGLKTGIKKADVEAGIAVSDENKTYTMSKNVLGTAATTTLKNGDVASTTDFANYKFVLATDTDAPAEPTDNQVGWVKDGNNFILKSFTTPGYTIATDANPKTITYTSWANESTLATVTGLNTKAKLNTDTRAIEGIDLTALTASGTHTVTLNDASVFSGKSVKIEKATNAAAEYTLDVKSELNPQYSYEWTFKKGTKNGTATLTETMSAGYTLDSTTGSETKGDILYNAKKTVTTTIAGLKNTVEVSKTADGANGNSIGIKGGTADNPTYTGITFDNSSATAIPQTGAITLGANVLAEANVTLTNKSGGGKYTLALDGTTVTAATVNAAQWFRSNNTTAVYQTVTQQGYAPASSTDNTKIIYYSDASGTPTTLATLKGLKNGFTEEQLNSTDILEKHEPTTQSAGQNVTGNNDDPEPTATTTTTPGNFTIKSNAILTNTNLTLTGVGEYKDYQLLLADDNSLKVTDIENADATWTYSKGTANLNVGKTEGWSNKQTKGAKTADISDDEYDRKTIVYTKAAPVTIATISGLATTGVSVNTDGKQSLVDSDGKDIVVFEFGEDTTEGEVRTHNATITLSANALATKNVTVTIPKKITGYAFTLDTDGDVFEPKDDDNYWTADGKGKAVYQYDTAAGYTLNEAATTLAYAKAKTTTLATITGLDKTKVGKIEKATEIEGIGVLSAPVADDPSTTTADESQNGVIKLWDDSLLGNKVTVTGDYEFELADEIATSDGGSKWYFNGGTATYRHYNTAGYEFATTKTGNNPKVVNYKAETPDTTYVTIKGLAKKIGNDNITADMVNNDNLLVVNEDNTVTISKDITGTSTITLANGVKTAKSGSTPATYYDYQIDATNSTYTTRVTDAPVWTFSKGTATLKQATSAGFELDELGENGQQKLTYSKEANPVVATVKGLNTNLAVATEDNIPTGGAQTVGKIYEAKTTGTGRTAVTTITGTDEALSYDATEKIITINNAALTTKNVTLTTTKTDDYKLAIGTGIDNAAVNTNAWVVSGTTANYKNYDTAFYALSNDKTIKYTAATKGTIYATVTGLKKDTTFTGSNTFTGLNGSGDGDATGGILTLTADNLGTSTVKITSKVAGNDQFLLALDSTAQAELSTLTVNNSVTADNGGKAVIKGTLGVGFTQEFGGKTLTYNKTANKSVTIATVTGLKKGTSVSVSDGIITLADTNLNDKNVAVTTSWGDTIYKLNYTPTAPQKDITNTVEIGSGQENAPANPKNKTPGWTISGTTGTLKGYVTSAGYTKSGSDTSLTYTGETLVNTTKNKTTKEITDYIYKDTTTLATIKGLKTTADKSNLISSNTINLTKDNTNGNLTLTGGTYAVSVASNYTGKSITGSAGADDITANGDKLVITGGKGDDAIDFGESRTVTNGNTLVYSSGDGNDVVEHFDFTKDKLQVKSGTVSVGKVGENVVVKVGTGSINLGSSYTGDTIDIYNAKNVKTTYAIAPAIATSGSNDLLADDNYSMDAANLSSLVQGDSASYTPYDFSSSFSLTKEDKLTPQISYSGTSDKK